MSGAGDPTSLRRRVELKIGEMTFEVIKQVRDCRDLVRSPAEPLARRIIGRDDYVDVLKTELLDLTAVVREAEVPVREARVWFQAASTVAINLERIGDCAVNSAEYALAMREPEVLLRYPLGSFFPPVLASLGRVRSALAAPDLKGAYRICQAELDTDELYCDVYGQALFELRSGHAPEDVIPALLISHYLERMGDALLNVGEAVLSTLLGERLKIHHYRGLSSALRAAGMTEALTKLEFQPIFGTRSGSRVAALRRKAVGAAPRRVIFKAGTIRKLAAEREGIARWEEILSGTPPRVLGFDQKEPHVFLVLEHLEGRTLEDLALHADWPEIEEALVAFQRLLEEVWASTRTPGSVGGKFAAQLDSRLGDVLKVYPQLQKPLRARGGVRVLVRRLSTLEAEFSAPFSVWTHGDCNLNNVIYDGGERKVRLVDLHRSSHADYVQDVSVFLVSCFRQPVFEPAVRARLLRMIRVFRGFSEVYRERGEDGTFDARLALGLARSLITSVRFTTEAALAQELFRRGLALVDALLSHSGRPWDEFRLGREHLLEEAGP